MSRIRIAPIVEGHGEEHTARILLQRVWTELLGGEHAEVLKPIRGKRQQLVHEKELSRAINLAVLKLAQLPVADERDLILILLDADEDPPCVLGPSVLSLAKLCRGDQDISCVIANVEYETWFVGCAEDLPDVLQVEPARVPTNPEAARAGKGWVEKHFAPGIRYSETVDQPRMTAAMNLVKVRQRCPSFDKLCRELQQRMKTP